MNAQLLLVSDMVYTNQVMIMSFGERLRSLRTERGLSIYMVSQATGIAEGNLSAIENDRRSVSDNVLEKLSALFKVSVPQLKAWKLLSKAKPDELEYLIDALDKMKLQNETSP